MDFRDWGLVAITEKNTCKSKRIIYYYLHVPYYSKEHNNEILVHIIVFHLPKPVIFIHKTSENGQKLT